MSISDEARQVIERPLDRNRVKQRPGRGNTQFDYIPADYAISLLNEAFSYAWDSRIISHTQFDSTIIVQLELTVPGNAAPVVKQQFGSCEINKGVGPGDAFKGAASDALKKCATLLGVALELYSDETPAPGAGFTAPKAPSAPSAPRSPAPTPPAAPRPPAAPVAAPAPPRAMPKPPVAPPSVPKVAGTPSAASVPAPSAAAAPPAPRAPAAPIAPPAKPAVPAAAAAAASRPNPFAGGSDAAAGPNVTQLNALNNLSSKKELSQPDMIAKAGIVDSMNSPKLTFDELTHSEAIEVIKAAQQ